MSVSSKDSATFACARMFTASFARFSTSDYKSFSPFLTFKEILPSPQQCLPYPPLGNSTETLGKLRVLKSITQLQIHHWGRGKPRHPSLQGSTPVNPTSGFIDKLPERLKSSRENEFGNVNTFSFLLLKSYNG